MRTHLEIERLFQSFEVPKYNSGAEMPRKNDSWLFLCPNTNITSDIRAVSSGRFENLQYSTGYLGTDWSSPYFVLTNIGKYIKCLSIMLQTATRTFRATDYNEITLPMCSLVETLADPRRAIEAKRSINEIFNTYLLQSEHGGELGKQQADDLFYLFTGVNEIMDAITLQFLNGDAQ